MQRDYPAARALHEESLALYREIGDKAGIASCLNNLGNVAREQGNYPAARALYEESLTLYREIGDKRGIAECLARLGGVAVGVGQVDRGANLLGAVEGLLGSMDAVLDREDRLPYDRAVASARAQLGEEAFEQAMQEGRAMSVEQAIHYALDDAEGDS
jgi:tetratricopeptide (TPR) repeat protein